MDFTLSQDQTEFKDAVIGFAQRELTDDLPEREKKGEFYWEGWRKCAEFGLLGMPVPERYGGLGLDPLSCVATLEGFGYGCRDHGLVFALNSQLWTCIKPILGFGSDAQKDKYLPSLIRGELVGGHAMTEPDAGSDAFGMRCRARKEGDRYILNGTKMFITNAPIADLLLVFAVTDPDKGFGGISGFIVEKDCPGFSVGRPLELMGLKTHDARSREVREQPREGDGFLRASGGIIAGIKEQNYRFGFQLRKRDNISAVTWQTEIRGGLAGNGHGNLNVVAGSLRYGEPWRDERHEGRFRA